MKEAKRIAANDGKITILETNTPAEIEDLKRLLNEQGIQIQEIIHSTSPDWKERVFPYSGSDAYAPIGGEGYLIIGKAK